MDSRFSRGALAAFEAFFRPWRGRRLAAVRLAGLPRDLPHDLPLVLASTHVSWWDPFVLRDVHLALRPRAPVYTAMLERELRRYPYFRLLGVFGLDPSSPASLRGAMRFVATRTAERRDATLIYFPQGRIWPSHRRPLGFRRGIAPFVHRVAPAAVLPVAMHHEPLSAPSPTVFVHAAAPILVPADGRLDVAALERSAEAASDALLAFVAAHGEDAAHAWPGPFDRLPPLLEP